jgi:hypothetical protein
MRYKQEAEVRRDDKEIEQETSERKGDTYQNQHWENQVW